MSSPFGCPSPVARALLIGIHTRRSPQHDGISSEIVGCENQPPAMRVRPEKETPLPARVQGQIDLHRMPSRFLAGSDDDSLFGERVVQTFVAHAEAERDGRSLIACGNDSHMGVEEGPWREPDAPDDPARCGCGQGAARLAAHGMLAEREDRIERALVRPRGFMKQIDSPNGRTGRVGCAAASAGRRQ